MLEIGQKAPGFSLTCQTPKLRTLEEFAGQWLVIYFYPKDDTPGCTVEAQEITKYYDEFKNNNIAVVGVSRDSVESHQAFAAKFGIPFILLSDPELEMITAYGAVHKDAEHNSKTDRISYIINPDGVVAAVFPDVDPATHAKQLLEAVAKAKAEFEAKE